MRLAVNKLGNRIVVRVERIDERIVVGTMNLDEFPGFVGESHYIM